jgi:hypothetical protein
VKHAPRLWQVESISSRLQFGSFNEHLWEQASMPKAVLRNGEIHLLEPIPPGWTDGQPLWVEEARNGESEADDHWLEELDVLCAAGNADDETRVAAALVELHRQEKELMRRKLGLP